ncbi:nitrilase-related carbon-nitrogen hydrolase [Zhihengliuella salsuginis]|uniref:Hydrolase n=1 Tax=Zhihengliuella salsuginis TaxID=578222 RepID=A0ABQ3GLM3_9MICC|nr:nitrilase-related carbon-nitrogen hydrolase [Zhihengliuella salsuginis]GHD12513.1 hydrolase [Zhihengliuella salsuginis]
MRIAVMQASASTPRAGGAGDDAVARNLAQIAAAAERAAADGVELLVTPELFTCGYAPAAVAPHLGDDVVRRIDDDVAATARAHRIHIVYSAPRRAGNGWTITAALVSPAGERLATHTKVHLFGDEEQEVFTAGTAAPPVVDVNGVGVGLLVCYDVEFPEMVRAAATAGADVVAVPTALTAEFTEVQDILLPARALESQVAIAYANHAGPAPSADGGIQLGGGSMILGPTGNHLADAPRVDSGTAPAALIAADVSAADAAAARDRVPYLRELRPELYRSWPERA